MARQLGVVQSARPARRPVDRARLGQRVGARHGLRLLDVRQRGGAPSPIVVTRVERPDGTVVNFTPDRSRVLTPDQAAPRHTTACNRSCRAAPAATPTSDPGGRQDRHDDRATSMPGSSATRRSSRPRSGWATRNEQSVDGQRARHQDPGRHAAGRDVAQVHAGRHRQHRSRDVPRSRSISAIGTQSEPGIVEFGLHATDGRSRQATPVDIDTEAAHRPTRGRPTTTAPKSTTTTAPRPPTTRRRSRRPPRRNRRPPKRDHDDHRSPKP